MQNPIQDRNSNTLDTDRIVRVLLKMTMPAFIGLFIQTLYNTINTIFVGRFVGADGIAGLSVVFPLQIMSIGLGMMVGIGGLSVISRSIGGGDNTIAERALGNSFTACIALSLVFMSIVLPLADFWLRLIGASDTVLPYARTYLIIISSGVVFNTIAMSLVNLVRAEGNARVAMVSMIIGGVISIILNIVFVAWLKMGMVGAGLATVIPQTLSMLYLLSYYFTGSSYLKVRVANLAPDFKVLRSMLAIGISAFMQTVASSLNGMILIHGVVTYGGDIAVSAFGIVQRMAMFTSIPAMCIGQGLQPVLGFNYGAKRYRLALKAIYLAYFAATVLSIAAFIAVRLYAEPIARIFTNDQQLVALAAYAMRLAFLALPLMGLVQVSQMIFQAIGKAVQSFVTAIIRPVVFTIPAVIILSRAFKLDGVLLSLPAADVLMFTLATILLIPVINEFRKAVAREKREALMMTPEA